MRKASARVIIAIKNNIISQKLSRYHEITFTPFHLYGLIRKRLSYFNSCDEELLYIVPQFW